MCYCSAACQQAGQDGIEQLGSFGDVGEAVGDLVAILDERGFDEFVAAMNEHLLDALGRILQVELESENVPGVFEGLVAARPALRDTGGTGGDIKRVAMPVKGHETGR